MLVHTDNGVIIEEDAYEQDTVDGMGDSRHGSAQRV
jgi:hypothetical protein